MTRITEDCNKYKWLLYELIIRDLKIKYRRSILGYFWSILNPLLMMLVLTIVFSTMFRFNIENYPVYLLTGQLIYNFFCESTNMAMIAILNSAPLIKKVYVPKYIFPLSRVLSCFTTMVFSLIALFIVMLITKIKFSITLMLLPILLFYVLIFTIGVGLLLSVFIVFFRDVQYLYGVFLSALNFLTPIFYPTNMLPQWLAKLMILNPLYNYIIFFRKIALYHVYPTINDHMVCFAFSIFSLILGSYIFYKKQDKFILYI